MELQTISWDLSLCIVRGRPIFWPLNIGRGICFDTRSTFPQVGFPSWHCQLFESASSFLLAPMESLSSQQKHWHQQSITYFPQAFDFRDPWQTVILSIRMRQRIWHYRDQRRPELHHKPSLIDKYSIEANKSFSTMNFFHSVPRTIVFIEFDNILNLHPLFDDINRKPKGTWYKLCSETRDKVICHSVLLEELKINMKIPRFFSIFVCISRMLSYMQKKLQ